MGKKIRADFRKKHETRTREGDLTREFQQEGLEEDSIVRGERLTGKGELTRKRTVITDSVEQTGSGESLQLQIDRDACRFGRVLTVHGLTSAVQAEDGTIFKCAVRRLLKTLSTDQRYVVAPGDRVWFRPEGQSEGFIERVEPRVGELCRTSKGRRHVIVANVDQVMIVSSAAEPPLKPNLIDRFLVTAEQISIRPLICINKVDLVNPADLQPLVGVYGQLGYPVFLVSARTGRGIEALRRQVIGKQTVVAGQSGVGKSSLLNAIEPGLDLRVKEVSVDTQKGRHTTTAGRLVPLQAGGYVVDTPGIRQFQLWDIIPAEVAGLFRDFRPYVSHCRYPDCTHTHEDECAVKDAVADGRLDARRYESYCHMLEE
jgi:ribosome biogenesis GTPase